MDTLWAKHLMKHHASQDIPLAYDEAFALGRYALEGCEGNNLALIQSIALLCALHNEATYRWRRDEQDDRVEQRHGHELPEDAAQQIAGIVAAIFECDIGKSEFGFLEPEVPLVMDNCGMGGDLVSTPNVSTIAAFIAASAGISMCKHGSPANTDSGGCGSSDFISSLCGINTFAKKREVRQSVQECHFGYTEATDVRYKKIHTQTHGVAQLPHMNDIIGPMTNPVHPRLLQRRMLGVNHLIPPRVVAEAYRILNRKGITHLEHGLFVRGFTSELHHEGIDELSVCKSGTQIIELKDGQIREFHWTADCFGIESVPIEAVSPKGDKGQYSLAILRGEIEGPSLSFVLANAAALFYLAGRSDNLNECYQMAEEVFRSGQPYQTMLAVREILSK